MAGHQKKNSVAFGMAVCVIAGALVGGMLGLAIMPRSAVALAIGGSLTSGAIAVAWVLMRHG